MREGLDVRILIASKSIYLKLLPSTLQKIRLEMICAYTLFFPMPMSTVNLLSEFSYVPLTLYVHMYMYINL